MVVEDLLRRAAPHVVAVVAPAVVIGDEPGVGFGLELADRSEVTAMEGRAPALLEDGAVEALAHSVVVGRAGRDPMVPDPLGRQMLPMKAPAMYSGPLSLSTARTLTPWRR